MESQDQPKSTVATSNDDGFDWQGEPVMDTADTGLHLFLSSIQQERLVTPGLSIGAYEPFGTVSNYQSLLAIALDNLITRATNFTAEAGSDLISATEQTLTPVKPFLSWETPLCRTESGAVFQRSHGTFIQYLGSSETSHEITRANENSTTYYTADAGSDWIRETRRGVLNQCDEYARLLQSKELWPVDPTVEQNWSGRGQHVEFGKDEQTAVNELLEYQDLLGTTASARVESVRCRRILLARKSIRCVRPLSKSQVLDEVAHLTRLQHAHIVRVIGTYTIKKELSILLYPVAQYNMETFLADLVSAAPDYLEWFEMCLSIRRFCPCLSGAVQYMHLNRIKHMDIKPQNILIWRGKGRTAEYKVYMADFGIARSYAQDASMDTDGQTSFTPKYAAPEVVQQQTRGISADIFSLGCVFLEMYAAVSNVNSKKGHFVLDVDPKIHDYVYLRAQYERNSTRHPLWQLQSILDSIPGENTSYQGHIAALNAYLENSSKLPDGKLARERLGLLGHQNMISRMIALEPRERPTSNELLKIFGKRLCCDVGPLPLESIEPVWDHLEEW